MNNEEINRTVSILFEPDEVYELRVFYKNDKKGAASGYFNNANVNKLIDVIQRHEGDPNVSGFYVTLNPVLSALLSARNCRTIKGASATSEPEILKRNWLQFDIDSSRPKASELSASNEEHEKAIKFTIELNELIKKDFNFPDGLIGDSGNGAHLLYRIDLPNDEASKGLVKKCQETIIQRYNDKSTGTDIQGFHDANRVWKLYGTMARKGDNTPDRPHRITKFIYVPEKIVTLTNEDLQRLKDAYIEEEEPETTQNNYIQNKNHKFDINNFINKNNIHIKNTKRSGSRTVYVLETCVFNSNHSGNGEACITISPDGKLGYKCHHNSCSGKHWSDLRELFEPGYIDQKKTYQNQNPTAIPELSLDQINKLNATERSRKLELSLPDDHFITIFVKWLSSMSDGYSEYSISGALWILSAISKGKFVLPLKQEKIKTNLWVFDIGKSTTSRKSTIVNKTRRIVESATDSHLPNQDYSLEGYLESLSIKPVTNNVRDEAAGLLSKFHQKYNDGIFDLECQLYDGQDIEKTLASKGRKEPHTYKVINPYITKLYATTPENLSRVMSIDDFLSGYGYRWIFVYPNYPHVRRPLELETQEDIEAWGKVLLKIKSLHNIFGQLTETIYFKIMPDAMSYYDSVCQELEAKAEETNNDILNSVIGRSEIHILKIAMLIELGKHELSTTIEIRSIEVATKMVTGFFIPSIMELINRLQEDIKNNKIEKLISILRRLGGTAHRTKILRDSHLVAKDFNECVDTMQQSGEIKIVRNSESKGEIFILQDNNDKLDISNVRKVRTTHIYTDSKDINANNAKTEGIDMHHGIEKSNIPANVAKFANVVKLEQRNPVTGIPEFTRLQQLLHKAKSRFEKEHGPLNSTNINKFAMKFCEWYDIRIPDNTKNLEYKPSQISLIASKIFGLTPDTINHANSEGEA